MLTHIANFCKRLRHETRHFGDIIGTLDQFFAFVKSTKRAVHVDQYFSLTGRQLRVMHDRSYHIAVFGLLGIENTRLRIECFGGEFQSFGQRLEDHAAWHAQATLNLTEVWIGNAAHIGQLTNGQPGQLPLAAEKLA